MLLPKIDHDNFKSNALKIQFNLNRIYLRFFDNFHFEFIPPKLNNVRNIKPIEKNAEKDVNNV